MKNTANKSIRSWFVSISLTSVLLLGVTVFNSSETVAADIVVYKNPSCGCCGKWVEHMEKAGYDVTVKNRQNLEPEKSLYGVPKKMQSCHTAVVDGYFIEGHVPASDVDRLLTERPEIKGLAVPGMPSGSPGMDYPGSQSVAYKVYAIGNQGRNTVFANH